MAKLHLLSIAATVGLALAACAQNDTMDDTSDRTASTSSTSSTSDPSISSSSNPSTPSSDTSTAQTMPDQSSPTSSDPSSAVAPVVVGLAVETPTGEPLGSVIEIVADARTGTPLFAVVTSEGVTTAIPYTAAASMVQDDALVMERARLASAPHVDQGEWRQAGDWTGESSGYWGEGETRTATPGTGTQPDASQQQPPEQQQQEPTRY